MTFLWSFAKFKSYLSISRFFVILIQNTVFFHNCHISIMTFGLLIYEFFSQFRKWMLQIFHCDCIIPFFNIISKFDIWIEKKEIRKFKNMKNISQHEVQIKIQLSTSRLSKAGIHAVITQFLWKKLFFQHFRKIFTWENSIRYNYVCMTRFSGFVFFFQ